MNIRVLVLVATFTVLAFAPITTGIVLTDGETNGFYSSEYALVELRDPAVATYDGAIPGLAATRPLPGEKLDLNSPAVKAYSDYLKGQRGLAIGWAKNVLPRLEVIREYELTLNGFAVKLNGHGYNQLNSMPGVGTVGPSWIYKPAMNRSPTLIGAPTMWAALGGQSVSGLGVKIGIIDTGIDASHPFMTDPSLVAPPGFPICDARNAAICGSLTSGKVIVAKVYQTLTNDDASDQRGHGTHVSGTAAGVAGTCAPFVGCTMSGIAPKAYLGNYNVFPGTCSTGACALVLQGGSFEHDIAAAVEDAVADGMDVLNLSLGGTPHPNDLLSNTLNHAVDAGLVVAVAAGNAGPGAATVSSPGTAEKVITAGASTNPHYLGIPVTEVNAPGSSFGAAVGAGPAFVPPMTADLDNWDTLDGPGDGRACTALPGTPAMGKIVLVRRGVCTFSLKNANAAAAGAISMIVTNSVVGDPIAMGEVAGFPFTIPAVMVSINDRPALVAYAAPNVGTELVTVNGLAPTEFYTFPGGADLIAGFSSRGPPPLQTPGQGLLTMNKIKPDVTAPGVNVYSSIPGAGFAFFQGTSMATPHVAGSAALLVQLHPGWSPEQVKSALVNSAKRPVGNEANGAPLLNPMSRGGGRIDLAAASMVSATLEGLPGEASIGFGSVPPVSGQSTSVALTVTSVSGVSVGYTVTIAQAVTLTGGSITVSSAGFLLGAGGVTTITVTITVSSSVAQGNYYGDIVLTGGPVVLQVPYWIRVVQQGRGAGQVRPV